MPEKSLTERIADDLRAAAARRAQEQAAEAEADRLALSQPSDPETYLMDAESDRQVEEMLANDQAELRAVKLAAVRLVGLWLRASVDARRDALVALTASLNFAKHGQDGEPGVHLVVRQALVCTEPWCLQEVAAGLPPRALEAIELTARSVPLNPDDQLALAADKVVDRALSLGLVEHVRRQSEDALKVPPDLGALPVKLAALLREET